MKKLIASAVSLSLGSGLLLLAGCNQDADLGKPALPVTQNKHLKVITFESDSFGYRINLDSVSAQWFQKFAVENGRLLEVHCPEQNVQIKINGKDFRTYFRDHIGQLMVEDQRTSPNGKQQIAFKIVTEAEGLEIRLDLPISQNSFGFHIKSNRSCKVEVIGNEQSDTNFIKELNPQEKLEFHIGSGQSFDKQNPIPIVVEPIKIDGPVEDQSAINAFVYRLQQARPLSPFGRTSLRYNGNCFWDADTWIFPSLALINPIAATYIPKFRLDASNQAQVSAKNWSLNLGRPIANKNFLGNLTNKNKAKVETGMKFPWESNSLGEESSPSETKFQEHISADVALMLNQTLALRMKDFDASLDSKNLGRIINETKNYYKNRIEVGNPSELKSTVSASEWHTVDNDLYTNAMLEVLYGFPMKLPKDKVTFLTFDDDKLNQYQQASALLAIFPAQNPKVEAESAAMLKRFLGKAAPQGPAMSHSIQALIAARIGETELAYDEWQKSWKSYTSDPLLYFQEKQNEGETYFYTGAAGCVNTVLYGFMGLRFDNDQPKSKLWKIPLENGYWLSAEPNLPKEWKSLQIDIQVLGKSYQLLVKNKELWVNGRSYGNSASKKRQ